MFKRILVPFDDSEGSARAFELAAALAIRHGGAVRLVHHFDVQVYPDAGGYGEPVIRAAREAAQRMLEAAQSRLTARGVDAHVMLCRVMGERLGRCIADEAEGWRADIVVLGSHGRRGVARALLGSGAEQIMRELTIPALVARGAPPPDGRFRRLLVAFDGSPPARKALAAAVELARHGNASLRLFHSIGNLAFLGDYQYGGPVIEEAKARGDQLLREAAEVARSAGVEQQSAIGVGTLGLGEAVAHDSAEWGADLVVIGTHGRKGWRRAVLGSGAVQIVRESHLPVLLIPGVDRSGPPR